VQKADSVATIENETSTAGQRKSLEDLLATLTRREAEVLDYLVKGMTNDQIALALFRSPKTIDKHCQNIYQKTGIHKRVSLAREVLRLRGEDAGRRNNAQVAAAETAVDVLYRKSRAWDKMAKFESIVSRSNGPEYFGHLTKALAQVFEVKMAGISEINADEGRGDIIAFCVDGELQVPFTYTLANSLCGATFAEGKLEHLDNLKKRFGDEECQIPQMGYDSYIGIRLTDSLLGPIGVLWISHDQPIEESEMVMDILKQFAPSVAAELAVQIALDQSVSD
jgi:DNA-binding CsgD family transcriptional regulator